MPWLKGGDNAATYPRLMRLAALPATDDRTLNEVTGWLVRCAFQCAAHMTDYLIDDGTARLLAGSEPNYKRLSKKATKVGLVSKEAVDGEVVWRMIDDSEFLHMRLRAEVEFDRKRDRDRRNDDLVMPVLLRDGDGCRYCSKTVDPRDRRGGRRREFDHRGDKDAPTTVDTYVVACGPCNRARGDDLVDVADRTLPLRPVPAQPYYHEDTVKKLARHFGEDFAALRASTQPATATSTTTARPEQMRPDQGNARSGTAPARPGTQPDTATATPQPAGPRDRDPADGGTPRPAPPARPEQMRPDQGDARSDTAHDRPGPDPGSTSGPRGGTRVGSGRVGSGLAGPGPGRGGALPPGRGDPPVRRARRGRRRSGGGA